jgi:hypothetical protein
LPTQPVSAIEADADREGKPALHADVAQAEIVVPEVVVVVLALA